MEISFFFKSITRLLLITIVLAFFQAASAQAPPAVPDTSKMKYNQISSALKLYVYPAKGQSQQQQKVDEF